MKKTIFTLGHSTRTSEELIELLKECNIQLLVDVRTIPKSRRNPQFNSDELEKTLKQQNIKYTHLKKLGGLRHSKKDSINLGWKNLSFRGFADHMQTEEFKSGLDELIKFSKKQNTAIMCAESLPWKCHRSLIADALIIRKIPVVHIINKNNSQNHKLTSFAKTKGQEIFYPKEE